MIDFHVDDATIDVLDIPIDKAGASRTHTMFAVAARNSVIAQRQALFEAAKLKLKVIDIPEMAQRNISALAEVPGRGLAMLSFHAGGGLLSVTFNGELYLARRIDVTLTQLLDPDIERRNACFDKITLELQRSLDHFERQFNFIAVQRLLLAPTGASWDRARAIATHPRIAHAARRAGFGVVCESRPSVEAVVAALESFG